jgi:hypothetical protein
VSDETREPVPCEYGYPEPCGKPSVYECTAAAYPYPMYGCEEHARLMHGYPTPPPRATYYRVVSRPT